MRAPSQAEARGALERFAAPGRLASLEQGVIRNVASPRALWIGGD